MLYYKFKKEKLESGGYAVRPRILVSVSGNLAQLEVPALIDSGCDITVIPESIAVAIGLNMDGERDTLYAFRECSEAVQSKATITFVGRAERESVTLNDIPILIVLTKESVEEQEIVLGVERIFDAFDITFKKSQNKIVFKPVKLLS